jgi:hypothetical protein
MKREEALELLKSGSISKEEFLLLTDEDSLTSSAIELKKSYGDSNNLHITWEGLWMLFDAKVRIYVDNEIQFEGSFKEGFNFSFPISKDALDIEVKLGSMKTTKFTVTELTPSKNYKINLKYNSTWGKFSKDVNIIEI